MRPYSGSPQNALTEAGADGFAADASRNMTTTPPSRRWIPSTVALLLLIPFLSGCATLGNGAVRLDVPFRRQEPNQCGVSALEMVLAYWNLPSDHDALAAELYIPAWKGSIPALLAESARRHGLAAGVRTACAEDLITSLRAGAPPIVLLGPLGSDPRGHFVVVTGIRADLTAFRLHGSRHPDRWWPADRFLQRWASGQNVAIFLPRLSAEGNPKSGE